MMVKHVAGRFIRKDYHYVLVNAETGQVASLPGLSTYRAFEHLRFVWFYAVAEQSDNPKETQKVDRHGKNPNAPRQKEDFDRPRPRNKQTNEGQYNRHNGVYKPREKRRLAIRRSEPAKQPNPDKNGCQETHTQPD
jgi:hypothetical protein